jgi:cytochrome c-type biogenesis protein CcmF
MINLGQIVFLIPLILCALQAVKYIGDVSNKKIFKIGLSHNFLSQATFLTILLSFLFLVHLFIISDFNYNLVLQHSHTAKPILYKITGVWGNHEGSMLLFLVILSAYGFFYSLVSKQPNEVVENQLISVKDRILGVHAILLFLLLCYTYFTSNPFDAVAEQFFGAEEGFGLNPLLQDIGLAIHPPLLYVGYAGLSIAFAYAIYVLQYKINGKKWTEYLRPWVLFSWSFLALGIAMGSWWAYRELGWGGFWFWDPVENISLVPWLIATALIHTILVTKKFNRFAFITIFLSLIAYMSALLGFFLVRSGVLSSVHTFASDPTRGTIMLAILFSIAAYSFTLFGKRYAQIKFIPEGQIFPVSREVGILFQTILLIVMTITILLGIFYPLVLEMFFQKRISVGEPYFNAVFIPISLAFILLAVFAPILKWQREKLSVVIKKSLFSFVLSAGLAVYLKLTYPQEMAFHLAFAVFASAWLAISAPEIIIRRLINKEKVSKGFASMIISHAAFGLLALAITLKVSFEIDTQIVFREGDTKEFADYKITLNSSEIYRGANYITQKPEFSVSKNGEDIGNFSPENRIYFPDLTKTHEADIGFSVLRDLYIVLGQTELEKQDLEEGKKEQYAFPTRVYIKPFIFFIWFSVLLMAFGGFLAMLPNKK